MATRKRLPHALLYAFLLITPAVAFATFLTVPHFETNDDAWLMLTLSGRVTSAEPTPWTVFMNFFASQLLAWLYQVAPQIPWYGLWHLTSLTLALWAIAYTVLTARFSWRRIGVFGLCVISLALPLLIRLQFTKTASFVGLGGIFLLYSTLTGQWAGNLEYRQAIPRVVWAGMLFVLAGSIRQEGLYLVVLVSLPLFCHLAWLAVRSRTVRSLALVGLTVSLGPLLLDLGHRYIYAHQPEWQSFNQLLPLKSAIIDYHRVSYNAQTQPYFAAVGWSENDYRMFQSWFYVDSTTYTPDKIRTILNHFPITTKSFDEVWRALQTFIMRVHNEGTVWFVLILSLAIVTGGLRRFDHIIVLVATVAQTFLLLVLLTLFFHLPVGVLHPLLMTPCWLALLLSLEDVPHRERSQFAPFLTGGSLVLLGAALFLLFTSSRLPLSQVLTSAAATERKNVALRDGLRLLNPQPTHTFVLWGAVFPYEAILPLEQTTYLQHFRAIGLGSTNQSPLQKRMLVACGISDLYRALFERNDIFLALSPNRHHPLLLRTYLAEHYNVHTTVEPVFRHGPLRFWQVRRKEAHPDKLTRRSIVGLQRSAL